MGAVHTTHSGAGADGRDAAPNSGAQAGSAGHDQGSEDHDQGAGDVDESLPAAEARRLREEVAQLRKAVESRPVIDQARGVLMASWHCGPETAWRILVDTSQHTNTKVREIAALLTRATHDRPLPDWLRRAVSAAYVRVTRAARENGLSAR
ncbi:MULTISPECIES: ANTAR domain-containing protein [unclassified Streptomyces]|uniref:ANTAR domain-containing protein n=1 Tax=unclassified Streptomyces TaxID=2593676 RepID=UPI0027DE213D|nr:MULTISPECIES: ANTAR domain-containing protein [unclassified Streptomyces]